MRACRAAGSCSRAFASRSVPRYFPPISSCCFAIVSCISAPSFLLNVLLVSVTETIFRVNAIDFLQNSFRDLGYPLLTVRQWIFEDTSRIGHQTIHGKIVSCRCDTQVLKQLTDGLLPFRLLPPFNIQAYSDLIISGREQEASLLIQG